MPVDWMVWHELYATRGSHADRLEVVRESIREVFDTAPRGKIHVTSMCSGDGRDLLGVLENHERAGDVKAHLVEIHPALVARAQAVAPAGVKVFEGDAGISDSYLQMPRADLLLSCGIFGNISEADIRNTINRWRMLCSDNAAVIWTRHGRDPDLRPVIRNWILEAGFEEQSYLGTEGGFGVGVARMIGEPEPLTPRTRFFEFLV